MEGVKDEVASTMIETLLPKIKPFIKPAVDKIQDYLGDNDKFVIIRRLKVGKSASVIIFDNNTEYEISNKDGKRTFTAGEETVINVFNVEEFIDALLKGEFKGKE